MKQTYYKSREEQIEFIEMFLSHQDGIRTNMDAYLLAEIDYKNKYDRRAYKNYYTFRVVFHRHVHNYRKSVTKSG